MYHRCNTTVVSCTWIPVVQHRRRYFVPWIFCTAITVPQNVTLQLPTYQDKQGKRFTLLSCFFQKGMQRLIRRRCKAFDLIGPDLFNQQPASTSIVRYYSRPLPAVDQHSQREHDDKRQEADEDYHRRLREMADAQRRRALVGASQVQPSEIFNSTRDQERLRSNGSTSCSIGAFTLPSRSRSVDESQWRTLIRLLREAEGELLTDQILTDTFGWVGRPASPGRLFLPSAVLFSALPLCNVRAQV